MHVKFRTCDCTASTNMVWLVLFHEINVRCSNSGKIKYNSAGNPTVGLFVGDALVGAIVGDADVGANVGEAVSALKRQRRVKR
mmetsp:Transcript_33633/g.81468  ORF Transcript_33633/g.81468 Transcript_33633/m.81468 type:complete len:83 (+) Transcript_33633:1201-1449(+)